MRLGGWIVLAAAAMGLAAPAAADEIPIWWSPTLGIESLDDIDARLDEPFAPDDFREVFRVEIKDNRATIHDDVAIDCRSLVRLVRAGYEPLRTVSFFRTFAERCFVFDALSRVRPR